MARLFDDASSQYLEHAAAVLTAAPFTMACWFRSDDAAVDQTLMSLSASGNDDNKLDLRASGTVAGDPVRFLTNASSIAVTTSGYTANTWHHACGVFAAVDSRAAYIDGGSKGTSTASVTPAGINRTRIGVSAGSVTAGRFMSGRIAEAGIWNVALTDAEVAVLADGFSPLFVRPQSLVAYWPMIGRYSPEIDKRGGFGMTLVNSPTAADHPRIIYPSKKRFYFAPASASSNGAAMYHHLQALGVY